MLTGLAASEVVIENPIPVGVPDQALTPDFTKLEITPQYGNFMLQPGNSKEMTVTIKNKENKTVSVKPNTVMTPYSQYNLDPEWISVKPESAEIPAGGSQKFTVKVSVPSDATSGNSGAQIAFTNETMPMSYPMPVPSYVHVFQLSLDVWTTPKIQIAPQYIYDSLQAGKEYDYEIKLKNIGKEAINIDPKLSNDNPYGQIPAAFTDDAITISSPSKVPAGATEVVKVHVNVPLDSKGSYNGGINLNIDDPSIREYEGRVQLSFNVWRQPTEAFVKSFSMKEAAPLTIEVSSGSSSPYPFGMGTNEKQPSFETKLVGPDGNAALKVTKTVIKGGVSMGGEIPPWELDSKGIYQESGVQLIETYKANGSKGEWKLKVLPNNTERFDYSITIGE
jgi:hypothetical protein